MDVRDEERVDVISADGTSIAVWAVGQGPPLVLVHGSMQDQDPELVASIVLDFLQA